MLPKALYRLSFRENRRRYLILKGIASKNRAYKGPDVVQIDLTDKCNINCLACWNNSPFIKRQNVRASLELDAVKKFIKDISALEVKNVIFSGGGEPFCYDKIWHILEWTQRHGINFHINTNFTLLGKEEIKRLLCFDKLSSLTISLWSGTADLYRRLHGADKETFYGILDNAGFINSIKRPELYVKVAVVVNKLNYGSLRELLDVVYKTGCRYVEFMVCDITQDTNNEFLLSREQLVFLKESFSALEGYIKRKRYNITIINKQRFLRRISSPGAFQGEYDTDTEKTPCYSGWVFLRLRANGDFNSCLKSHRMPIGNLYKESVLSAWNNPLQQEFRRQSLLVPKDKEYFKFIGNNGTDKAGCIFTCDNIDINCRIHKLARFLP